MKGMKLLCSRAIFSLEIILMFLLITNEDGSMNIFDFQTKNFDVCMKIRVV